MADDLASAKQKLLGNADNGIPKLNCKSLPKDRSDPLWDRIESKYSLSLGELSALKNDVFQQGTTIEAIELFIVSILLFLTAARVLFFVCFFVFTFPDVISDVFHAVYIYIYIVR
jgi:hypothetical protein